jgi:hypothetical protein
MLQSDKTECPPGVADQEVVRVFSEELPRQLERGWCSVERDGDWPRYVWGRSVFGLEEGGFETVAWEARVVNRGVPEYKAYPIQRGRHASAMPPHVEEALWPD